MVTLDEIADELSRRLIRIFRCDADGGIQKELAANLWSEIPL
jgi:hypothetical protein